MVAVCMYGCLLLSIGDTYLHLRKIKLQDLTVLPETTYIRGINKKEPDSCRHHKADLLHRNGKESFRQLRVIGSWP
jgi:hypothetical protein